MEEAHPLIRTKLRPPFIRPRVIPRPRLRERIAQGLQGPLTLITAPAGFGKTTLVASCVSGCGLEVAWLSLDKDDNRTQHFLRYLVAALQERDNGVGSEAAQLLETVQEIPPEVVLTSLVNELERSGREMALVLDDYQFVKSQAVQQAVEFFLEHCPRTFHLLIASRSDPLLPITRLRARGQLVELRAADLRFTRGETTQFLNEMMDLGLDGEAISVLEERTEGWIAGLQMAALALQGTLARQDREAVRGFIEGFSGTNRYILDYLLEEVLASQPETIRQFLQYTSILERLSAPLCDFLLATAGSTGPATAERSAAILAQLEQANLFLVPLDDERIWYRYHHLFADLLRARLQQAKPDVISLLHVRAAEWLEENRFIPEAIGHLFAADEPGRAADLIAHYGPARLAASDLSVLAMAEHLPQAMILERPEIGLYRAWLLITQGRIADAVPLLQALAARPVNSAPGSGERWIQTIVATALAFLAPPESPPGAAPLPDYALVEEIPAGEPILRNAADFLYGMTVGRQGNLDKAAEVSLRCIEREKAADGTEGIPTLAPFLTRLYLMQGRLRECASLCREFLDPIRQQGIRFIHTAGSMKIDLGEVLYEWNKLDGAEQHIRDGLQDNEPWQNIMTDGFGLVALARVLQAKGAYADALQVVEKFEKRMLAQAHPREFDKDLRTLGVRVQLAGGNLDEAAHWADEVSLSEDYEQHEALYHITLGRIRLAQGRYAEVEKLLAGVLPTPGVGSRTGRQVESDLLLAVAVAGQGRLPEAFPLVEASLAQAEPEGHLRIFLDVGEPARDLLAAYVRSGTGAHEAYAQKVLAAFAVTGAGAALQGAEAAGLVEPLSEREVEVLQLIALGKTNKEIARELVIAPGTVKAHTSSIYRKLDVANRTEAAARGREMGVLS